MTVVPQGNVLGEAVVDMVCDVKLGRGKYAGKIIAIGKLRLFTPGILWYTVINM